MNKLFIFSLLFFLGITTVYSQPNPPTNLAAQVIVQHNNRAVKLNWDGPANVKYRVFKKLGALSDTTQFFRIATNLSNKTFVDQMIILNQTYCYYVVAYNNAGVSGQSNVVEITITPPQIGVAVITGRVFNDVNNNPIPRAKIELISNTTFGNRFGVTDSLGNFKIRVPVGSYYLQTTANGFVREFYNNVTSIQQATLIQLSNGDSLNFAIGLTPITPPVTFTLSGNVTKDGGQPIRAKVTVINLRNNTHFNPSLRRHTITDSLGNYSIRVRQNDTVVVFCLPMDFTLQPEFYNDKQTFADADRIVITGNVSNINFVISPRPVFNNGISGLVKNEDNEGVESFVSAFRKNTTPSIIPIRRRITVSTDTLGYYQFTNLIPGNYILLAIPKSGYMPTFFRYDGTQTMNWRQADSIVVTETSLITNINFTVIPTITPGFAKLTGYVKDNLNRPVEGAFVYAVDDNTNIFNYAITDRNGFYQIEGFGLSTYSVYADNYGYSNSGARSITFDNQNNYHKQLNLMLTIDSPTSTGNQNVPENFELAQNYPNPFNPTTKISWQSPISAWQTLKVYNILGKEVATLVNEWREAGRYSIDFNADNLTTGIYFYRLTIGNYSEVRKMILIK